MQVVDVLVKPVISEKAVRLAGNSKYAFLVNSAASKEDIKKAVERFYSVNVVAVQTVRFPASPRRQTKKRVENAGILHKKAYVTLKEGQSLNLLEVGE